MVSTLNIIPTVFSLDKKEFYDKLNNIHRVSKKIQIDFMDGSFVKSKSVNPVHINLKDYDNVFEAHLMVKKPVVFFEKIRFLGFKKIIFHYESFKDENEIVKFCDFLKKQRIKTVIAVNPETKMDKLLPLFSKIGFVLVMGVHPGKEGQKLIRETYQKIRKIKKYDKKILVQVDGGVNVKNAKLLFKAGADFLNSGSYISNNDNPREALKSLL